MSDKGELGAQEGEDRVDKIMIRISPALFGPSLGGIYQTQSLTCDTI